MKLTVTDSDAKNALITISKKAVKIKLNRHWAEDRKRAAIDTLSRVAESVIGRNLGCSLHGEWNPEAETDTLELTTNSNKVVAVNIN